MSNDNPDRLGIRIGRLVREARTREKMKLTDLAEKVGRTAAQISTLERGIYQWTDSVLESCAQALDLPLAALFAESDEIVLKLPRDPEALKQAKRLALRLRTASADEIQGMLVWSVLYRERTEEGSNPGKENGVGASGKDPTSLGESLSHILHQNGAHSSSS